MQDCVREAIWHKTCFKLTMWITRPVWLWLRLATTAISTVDLQGADGNWATVGWRRRGGTCVCKQREKRKSKRRGLRGGTLNVGTMTGKASWLTWCQGGRWIFCVIRTTRFNGSEVRSSGAGFKLFYHDVDGKRNGVGVVLKGTLVMNVWRSCIVSL